MVGFIRACLVCLMFVAAIAPAMAEECEVAGPTEEEKRAAAIQEPLSPVLTLPEVAGPADSTQEQSVPALTLPSEPLVSKTSILSSDFQEKELGFIEKHPIVTYAPVQTWNGVCWVGRKTKLNKLGHVAQKSGEAFSDSFVAFGKRTEKYHPGMQTISYGMGILLPVLLKLIPR